jgi:hypothetical protein
VSKYHVESSALISARPEEIYAILSDYQNQHQAILPEKYFSKLEVEQGGTGAGTIIRTQVKVMGSTSNYHMKVDEPEPGRVITETDMDTGLVTTFTLKPTTDSQQTLVTIATDSEAKAGIAGFLEKLLSPPMMRNIYKKELTQLASYIKGKKAALNAI